MKSFFIFILLVCLFQGRAAARETDNITHDNIVIPDTAIIVPDSIIDARLTGIEVDTSAIKVKPAFKPNPTKAIIYSALLPGLGQIYNRKYWKLPLVYGGFLGCIYAITWNGNQYNGYKDAYSDWTTNEGSSWSNYAPVSWGNPSQWSEQQKERFATSLKNKKDYYRHYRDMSYIVTAGVYALWIIDAYVDAQLFDFDISPDLSMRVTPALLEMSAANNSRTVGVQCSFKF